MCKRSCAKLPKVFILALALVLAWARPAKAEGRLTLLLGTYAFSISPSGSASGVGNYSAKYSYEVLSHWALSAGATFLISGAVTGQTGFGFDFGGAYYPFTEAGVTHEKLGSLDSISWTTWRPYLGAAFRQRQIQLVTQPTYVGVGGILGTDYQLNRHFSLCSEFHYDILNGANNTSATQINFLAGGSIHF